MALARKTLLGLAALLGSLSAPVLANAQSSQVFNPYPLDRLFLTDDNAVPFNKALSFNSETAVANFFGVGSPEASVASQFFAGYTGSAAGMLFSRFPGGGGRARLYGGNILALSHLQTINGPLSITSEGYSFSAQINLAGVTSFAAAASTIQKDLDANVPVAALTTGSSIAPMSVPLMGSLDQSVLTVNNVSNGTIQIGSYLSGSGVTKNIQIVAQLSGTHNGAGTYAVQNPNDNQRTPLENMTDSYGVLTVGSVGSGTVAVGQDVAGAGVAADTAIQAHLNGAGAGSTWVVERAQSVGREAMTTTAAPLDVTYDHVKGATANSNSFWIEQDGHNNVLTSSVSYATSATGTAAAALRLTQAKGAYDSTPGQVVTSASAWMNNITQTQSPAFSSFQFVGRLAATTNTGLQQWAQSTAGAYTYLGPTGDTQPAVDQYALNRLFLDTSNKTPLGEVLPFTNATAVADYYGKTSHEAQLANEFFKGYTGSSATMLFALYPALPWKANLYGSNVSGMLAQLQTINGPLSITSDGLNYTGSVNLSGVASFSAAATDITAALNKNIPIAATTTASSIAAASVKFSGSIKDAVLTVKSLSPGQSIEPGSYITGLGVPAGTQITSQISGTPNGAGVYGLFQREGTIAIENLTDNYGILTVGSASSGAVAVGQEVTGTKVAARTEIAAHLSGSTWVVNNAQTVGSENLTMKGAPLSVTYNAVTGDDGENSGSFWVSGKFSGSAIASSTLTYATSATGMAAEMLGLAQGEAYLSSTGGFSTSASDWMNNFVDTEADEFSSFQTTYNPKGATPPGLQAAMEAWAQSTGGQFDYLHGWSAKTPPIEGSLSAAQLFAEGPTAAVPEPSTWAMMLLGFSGLGLVRYWPRLSTWRSASLAQEPTPHAMTDCRPGARAAVLSNFFLVKRCGDGTLGRLGRGQGVAGRKIKRAKLRLPAGTIALVALTLFVHVSQAFSQSSTGPAYPCSRLILTESSNTGAHEIFAFTSASAVENFFGDTGTPFGHNRLTSDFFSGSSSLSCTPTLMFVRFPTGQARAHLFGGDVHNLKINCTGCETNTVSAVINGVPVSSGNISMAGSPGIPTMITRIEDALNANLPNLGSMSSSSTITPQNSGPMLGYIQHIHFAITSGLPPGGVPLGAQLCDYPQPTPYLPDCVKGEFTYMIGSNWISNVSYSNIGNTQNVVRTAAQKTYDMFEINGAWPSASVENFTAYWGLLTVVCPCTGIIQTGQDVTGAGVGVPTAIWSNVSGGTACDSNCNGPQVGSYCLGDACDGSTWTLGGPIATIGQKISGVALHTRPSRFSAQNKPKTLGGKLVRQFLEINVHEFSWGLASSISCVSDVTGDVAATFLLRCGDPGVMDVTRGTLITNIGQALSNIAPYNKVLWGSFQTDSFPCEPTSVANYEGGPGFTPGEDRDYDKWSKSQPGGWPHYFAGCEWAYKRTQPIVDFPYH